MHVHSGEDNGATKPEVVSEDDSDSGDVLRRSWRHQVGGFLVGALGSFLLSVSAACVRAMDHAVPDIEVSLILAMQNVFWHKFAFLP